MTFKFTAHIYSSPDMAPQQNPQGIVKGKDTQVNHHAQVANQFQLSIQGGHRADFGHSASTQATIGNVSMIDGCHAYNLSARMGGNGI